MRYCFVVVFSFLFSVSLFSQSSPMEIKYRVMDFQALRYYPFTVPADSIIRKVVASEFDFIVPDSSYKKTSVNLVTNREFISGQVAHSVQAKDLIYTYLIQPYGPWLQYAKPLNADNRELILTVGLHRQEGSEAIYEFVGKNNVDYLLDEIFNVRPFINPLSEAGMGKYNYFLSGRQVMAGRTVYEIAFFSKDVKADAFAGYCFIDAEEYFPVKIVFTINNLSRRSFLTDILFEQTFEKSDASVIVTKKHSMLTIGDGMRGNILVDRVVDFSGTGNSLTASEREINNVVAIAASTRHFRNLKIFSRFLLTDHFTVGGENGWFDWGPITQSASYNKMEGFRFKVGGNTTASLNKHFMLGGYVAYGTSDKRYKYRGDVAYSFLAKEKDIWEFPKRLLSLSYVNDLNIPGEDILTTNRDFILYSLSRSKAKNLSWQKMAAVAYEHEWANRLSWKVGARYLYDQPMGQVQYIRKGSGERLKGITTSEVDLSLRYAPHELFFQHRDKRFYLRHGDVVLNLRHRVGLEGLFDADYHYHITTLNLYKKVEFPSRTGAADIDLSAGKVWNRVPFPLLFIPSGNQSFIFEEGDHNLMDYYEFVTDQYLAGSLRCQFNWSPANWWLPNSKIRTTLGAKAIYGPLSDKNNPDLHPSLFAFNNGINPLGHAPYVEMNVGFSNILKLFGIEWVQRLTYLDRDAYGKKRRRGALFISTVFSF